MLLMFLKSLFSRKGCEFKPCKNLPSLSVSALWSRSVMPQEWQTIKLRRIIAWNASRDLHRCCLGTCVLVRLHELLYLPVVHGASRACAKKTWHGAAWHRRVWSGSNMGGAVK